MFKAPEAVSLNPSKICLVEVFKESVIKSPLASIAEASVAVNHEDTVPIKSKAPPEIVYFNLEASLAAPKYNPSEPI